MTNTEKPKAKAQKHSKRGSKAGSTTRGKQTILSTELIPLPKPKLRQQDIRKLRYLPTSVRDALHHLRSFTLDYEQDGEYLLNLVRDEIILGELWHGKQKDRLFCFFGALKEVIASGCQATSELGLVSDEDAVLLFFTNN